MPKWVLFVMFLNTTTGEVEDWKEPAPFNTPNECSTALVKARSDMEVQRPDIFKDRILICDVMPEAQIVEAREFITSQFEENPF